MPWRVAISVGQKRRNENTGEKQSWMNAASLQKRKLTATLRRNLKESDDQLPPKYHNRSSFDPPTLLQSQTRAN